MLVTFSQGKMNFQMAHQAAFRKWVLLTLFSFFCPQHPDRLLGSAPCQRLPRSHKHTEPQKETEQIFPMVSVKTSALADSFQLNFVL